MVVCMYTLSFIGRKSHIMDETQMVEIPSFDLEKAKKSTLPVSNHLKWFYNNLVLAKNTKMRTIHHNMKILLFDFALDYNKCVHTRQEDSDIWDGLQ